VLYLGFWYRRFRAAAFAAAVGSLVWTVIIIMPFQPFSYIPPIMVDGGPGTWFALAYVLYLAIGVGIFSSVSSLLYTIEVHERRVVSSAAMLLGFTLWNVGLVASCVLLGLGGVMGGYASTIGNASEKAVENLLSPFVYPITVAVLVAAVGAVLTLFAMISARARSN